LPASSPWHSTILCPGPSPVRELADRLREAASPAGGQRVLFVDQFEEAFTAGTDRPVQEGVGGPLLDLVDQQDIAVVLAIRADHLGRCATFPDLADRLAGNDILVGPMRDSELRRSAELPAPPPRGAAPRFPTWPSGWPATTSWSGPCATASCAAASNSPPSAPGSRPSPAS